MEEKKDLILSQNQENGISVFASKDAFELGQRMGRVFSESTLVPSQYQGNLGNCLIALNMAYRMKADPLMVMQNLVIVKNKPTFEAKFAIACFNATNKYTTIKYRMTGEKGKDTWGCIAYAIEKSTGELCEGMEVTIGMAKAEGWYNTNPKWKNIPELMLRYRAASWFIRTTDPGVMMGFQTTEELEDIGGKVNDDEIVDFTEVNTPVGEDANTEQIVVPETEAAPAEEPAAPAPEPAPEPEPPTAEPEAAPESNKRPVGRPKKEEAMGAQPTPDLFK